MLAPPRNPLRALIAGVLSSVLLLAACGGSERPSVLETGRDVYGSTCSVCHGPRGGGEIGPSLESVAETWPTCGEHIEWIELGSDGWKAEFGDVYGATLKPVIGGMPGQGSTLEAEEIAAVAAYERIEFGGLDQDSTLTECGLDTGG
ncbi:MAG: cytochrome c [Acidimicrobiia bacterium]